MSLVDVTCVLPSFKELDGLEDKIWNVGYDCIPQGSHSVDCFLHSEGEKVMVSSYQFFSPIEEAFPDIIEMLGKLKTIDPKAYIESIALPQDKT